MRPLTVSQTISCPREQLFAYLSDVSNYQEFSDHYLAEMRLERLDSSGRGASFSFRLRFPPARWWGDMVLVELQPPYRISAEGRMGRVGRIPIEASYTLTTVAQGMTRVEYSFRCETQKPIDRFKEALGMRSWTKLQARRALRRLASVVETGQSVAQPVRAAAG